MASVTVVVPTYNRAALLEATLRSILVQTVPIDEIIVVDDGSTDNTEEVCGRQPKSVRYIRQQNSGLPAVARNRGIDQASGSWIALCDSDDIWHPQKLEVQLAAMKAAGVEWSVTGFELIGPDGMRVPSRRLGFEREFAVFKQTRRTPSEHFARWLARTQIPTSVGSVDVFSGDAFGMLFEGNVCLTSTALIARHLLSRAGTFDPGFIRAEDTEFFHRLSAYAPVAIVMHPLIEYRVGHPSVMSARDLSPFMKFTLESLDRTARLRPEMTSAERQAHRRGRARLHMTLAYERLSSLDRSGARRALYDGWRDGAISPRSMALFAATMVPLVVLKGMHSAKRTLRTAVQAVSARGAPRIKAQRIRSTMNEYKRPAETETASQTESDRDAG
jgi:glycosyltransferase involved in cell wall biosynthesis